MSVCAVKVVISLTLPTPSGTGTLCGRPSLHMFCLFRRRFRKLTQCPRRYLHWMFFTSSGSARPHSRFRSSTWSPTSTSGSSSYLIGVILIAPTSTPAALCRTGLHLQRVRFASLGWGDRSGSFPCGAVGVSVATLRGRILRSASAGLQRARSRAPPYFQRRLVPQRSRVDNDSSGPSGLPLRLRVCPKDV